MRKIKEGLNLPLSGPPSDLIDDCREIHHVALIDSDYVEMRPTFYVKTNDKVKLGQKLFENKRNPGVYFTAPGSGVVIAINRGERRSFQSLVIELDHREEQIDFNSFKDRALNHWTADQVQALLLESGLWCALRTRPFSCSPAPDTKPHSIFVTAIDTNPLAVDPEVLIALHRDDFERGLEILAVLSDTPIYLCVKDHSSLTSSNPRIHLKRFSGPHPAGNVGTHIHFVDPVDEQKTVWHIGFQDVIAVGKLFYTGKLWLERYVALCGPMAKNPRIMRTRIGACVSEMLGPDEKKLASNSIRVVSGSVLNGHKAEGVYDYLGRFHSQVTLLEEDLGRHLLGWARPGFQTYSAARVMFSKLIPGISFNMNTNRHGSKRSIVPIGMYEKVLPGDFLATPLLKAIVSGDVESAIALGCLELDEEDLALCTFVCPSKINYGAALRNLLSAIAKEG